MAYRRCDLFGGNRLMLYRPMKKVPDKLKCCEKVTLFCLLASLKTLNSRQGQIDPCRCQTELAGTQGRNNMVSAIYVAIAICYLILAVYYGV
jgi:hypothetical protein